MALLLLLAASGRAVAAATVDHQLRSGSALEAQAVARHCLHLGVSHAILPVTVPPAASLQAQARTARYAALANWATAEKIDVILTAHHADDQAETLLMRLGRGAGLGGLAGVRATRVLSQGVRLARPLLGWRKSELGALVESAGIAACSDPANSDPRHDRTAARAWLAGNPALDPLRVAMCARHLAEAEAAMEWAAEHLARERLTVAGESLLIDPADLPDELARRLLLIGIVRLGELPPRGPDLARALVTLRRGGRCTLGRLALCGGETWTLRPAPPRR